MMLRKSWHRMMVMVVAICLLVGMTAVSGGIPVFADDPGPGDLAHETFDGIATGAKPGGSGWSFKETNGNVTVAEVPSATDKSLKIERTATDTGTNLYARQTLASAIAGQYVVRAKVMAAQTDAIIIAMQLRSSDSNELATIMFTQDGNIRYQTASSSVIMQSYAADTWYDIAVVLDTDTQLYSVIIDGVAKTGALAFKNANAHNLKQFDYQTYRTTPGIAYWDELHLYTHDLSLNPSTTTLALGTSASLAATVIPAMDVLQAITWSSSDNGIVRVDENGTITATGYGEAVITASAPGGVLDQCTVTVPSGPAVPVAGIAVSPLNAAMYVGESKTVTAQLDPFYATDKKMVWSSSQPSVVSVVYDVYGGAATLTALQAGTAIVTATSDDGGYTANVNVAVRTPGDVFSEGFESYPDGTKPGTLSIPTVSGVTATTAARTDGAGEAFRIVKPAATETSYNVTASLPAGHTKMKLSLQAMAEQTNAVVYAAIVRNSAGTAVLYAAFHSNGNIAVMNNGSWLSLMPYEAGRWYQFELAVNADTDTYDLYIDGKPVKLGLDLISPADEIRKLQFGIYGPSSGNAWFDDLQLSSYKAVTGLSLASLPEQLALGDTIVLRPDFTPADPTFAAVQWSSSDPDIIRVDAFGNATGVATGDAVLTAVSADGSFTDSAEIEVYVQHPEGVAPDTGAFTLPVGSERMLTATVLPANASDKTVSWSSSNEAVATVDEEGNVSAVATGTAQIVATTNDGGLTATSVVTVVVRTVQASFYVSPSGSDSNPGTEELPFLTIQRARDAVRTIRDAMTGDIIVYLRDGSYRQQSTLQFDERDSGSNGYWIVYQAYEDETPVIEGGRDITGWTLYDPVRHIYKADAGSDIETRQLYVNGVRAVRARSEGGLTNPVRTATGYTSDDTVLTSWNHISDLEFVYKAEWTNPRNGVQSITTEDGHAVITMKQPGWRYVTIRPSVVNPWYLENAYELLDEPGEWYLDRSTDTFFYMPRSGEDMSTAQVVAPVVEELVTVSGSSLDTPVDGIHFAGLTFSYTTWLRPSSDLGHADAQNNLLRYGIDKLPIGAVTVERANHIVFERNHFTKLGIMAIKMVGGVRNSLIRGNRFDDISGGAINVGDPTKSDPEIYSPSDPHRLLKNVDIVNNYIHDIGIDYRSSAAIGLGFVVDADISNNEIFNVPYDGITIGYGLAHVKTSALRNANIHANFIHDLLGDEIYDGGAIYTLGGTGGTAGHKNVISENYLRNQQNRYGVIYNDEGSTYWQSERNVIDQSETPVWDEIFPVSWAFVNGPLTSHDIVFDTNYTTTANMKLVGIDSSESNTQVYPDANWPVEAQAIIANAGLEPAYRDLAAGIPERIVLPAALTLSSEGSTQLDVSATTGKDVPVDLSGAVITYASGNEAVARVDATGEVEGIGPGATVIRVYVQVGDMRWTRTVPVYVDDSFDHIEVYYVENKAKHPLGDTYAMLQGERRQLSIQAISLYGRRMTVTDVAYTSSDPLMVQIGAGGLLTALAGGSAELAISLKADGVLQTRTIAVDVQAFGDPAGLEYDPYPIDDVIADPEHWYVQATDGNLVADEGSMTVVTPSGFATYQGGTFGDELLTMDLQLDAESGWPSLVLRSAQPNKDFTSSTNALYMFSFKPDVIELHRFNGGVRTVVYGNINGYTSIGGAAIPNNFLPAHELHRVQVGAVNEGGGVRLILNIDGENLIYFLDTEPNRITAPGYFGVYARTGTMTLRAPATE